jgi:hypothetical protein
VIFYQCVLILFGLVIHMHVTPTCDYNITPNFVCNSSEVLKRFSYYQVLGNIFMHFETHDEMR